MERKFGPIAMGNKRFYLDFTCSIDMGRPVIKGYSAGCNLNCVFCWSMTKDYLKGETRFIPPRGFGKLPEIQGYYSPQKLANIIEQVARERPPSIFGKYEPQPDPDKKIEWFEIAGCEPLLSVNHILELLEIFKEKSFNFFILTNGIILGRNENLCKLLLQYEKNLFINIGIKAGTLDGFLERTRGRIEDFDKPFNAIAYLVQLGFRNFSVSIMGDSRILPQEEKINAAEKIRTTGYSGEIYEESYSPLYAATYRIKESRRFPSLESISWKGVYKK